MELSGSTVLPAPVIVQYLQHRQWQHPCGRSPFTLHSHVSHGSSGMPCMCVGVFSVPVAPVSPPLSCSCRAVICHPASCRAPWCSCLCAFQACSGRSCVCRRLRAVGNCGLALLCSVSWLRCVWDSPSPGIIAPRHHAPVNSFLESYVRCRRWYFPVARRASPGVVLLVAVGRSQ